MRYAKIFVNQGVLAVELWDGLFAQQYQPVSCFQTPGALLAYMTAWVEKGERN